MEPKVYGYARVSSKDQNLERQIIAMRNYGVPEKNIYVEKQSGKHVSISRRSKNLHEVWGRRKPPYAC